VNVRTESGTDRPDGHKTGGMDAQPTPAARQPTSDDRLAALERAISNLVSRVEVLERVIQDRYP